MSRTMLETELAGEKLANRCKVVFNATDFDQSAQTGSE